MSWFGPQHVELPPLEPMMFSTTTTSETSAERAETLARTLATLAAIEHPTVAERRARERLGDALEALAGHIKVDGPA